MQITNEDNMALMARYPDNYFDLAIVDPPYGIGASGKTYGKRKKKHIVKDWDNETPDEKYFEELFRVSKNQIIWGGNYFDLPLTNGWIIWDKDRQKETTFSDGEMAWTSFLSLLKITKLKYDGFLGMDSDGRMHPTQKPIKLYKWLLMNYAKPNDKILDTHLGSGSIAIACHDLGFDLTACELDTDYFNGALKRLENHKLQLKIF
jgi:site-specific DNA-methyltransferase (adenine-specific)